MGGKEPVSVSVVFATYNRKEMLKECLDSLCNQTYPKDKYEIIVVNDGSTDGTEEVLREYEEKAPCKFRWFTQKNQGVAAALNHGIKKAIGEIICFTGDDCIADEKWIKELVKALDDEKIGGVGGRIEAYNPETLVEKYGGKIVNQEANINVFVLTGSSLFRKNVIEKIGGFDENLRRCEDIDFGIRIKLEGYELKYAPKAIVYHRHRCTFRGLIKQHYEYGIGMAMLNKKYINAFHLRYHIPVLTFRIIRSIASIGCLLFIKNRKNYLLENFFQIIISASTLAGLVKGKLCEKYPGTKVNNRIEFINESLTDAVRKKISALKSYTKSTFLYHYLLSFFR